MEYGTYFIGVSHTVKILSISGRESSNLNNPELYELIAGGEEIEPNGTFEIYNSDGTLFDKARGEFNEHETILGHMHKEDLTILLRSIRL